MCQPSTHGSVIVLCPRITRRDPDYWGADLLCPAGRLSALEMNEAYFDMGVDGATGRMEVTAETVLEWPRLLSQMTEGEEGP